jgi:hypothetical protein
VLLRGLRSNDFLCGFIFIEITKIVIGSPSLTQFLFLYPDLGPAILDNIDEVKPIVSKNINIPLIKQLSIYKIKSPIGECPYIYNI